MHTPFDPEHVYVQLLDSADAVPDDVDAGFWQQIGNWPATMARSVQQRPEMVTEDE